MIAPIAIMTTISRRRCVRCIRDLRKPSFWWVASSRIFSSEHLLSIKMICIAQSKWLLNADVVVNQHGPIDICVWGNILVEGPMNQEDREHATNR